MAILKFADRLLLAAVVCLTNFGPFITAAMATDPPQVIVYKAGALAKAGKVSDAMALVDSGLQRFAGNDLLLAEKALLYVFSDDQKNARKYIALALDRPKPSADAFDVCLDCLEELDDAEGQYKVVTKALKLVASDNRLNLKAGILLRERGDFQEAERLIRASCSSFPATLGAWEELLKVDCHLEHWKALVTDCLAMEKYCADKPVYKKRLPYARCLAMKVAALLKLKQPKEALTAVNTAIAISPLDRRLFMQRLEINKALNNKAACAADEAKIKSFNDMY